MNDGYSYTSNTVKLLKHLDTLQDIQDGIIAPIMVHCIPTHRCQLNCIHCCFKNRKDRQADLPLKDFKAAMLQFYNLGTGALEFTGGGDPTLWPHINEGGQFAWDLGCNIGMITNGVNPEKVENWSLYDWVRISLNTLDYRDKIDMTEFRKADTVLSFCYIWNESSDNNIQRVIDFANREEIVCRLAPDCIQSLQDIDRDLIYIRNVLKSFKNNRYVFLSDFNVDTHRRNNNCYIHMIKPCFYVDGYVYACPSAELALENDRQIAPHARICHFSEIEKYYKSDAAAKPNRLACSYCKYNKQQELLEDLLTETDFNEFA